MNFEKIKNINEVIETRKKAEKQEMLMKQIEEISLLYAHKKFTETINSGQTDYKLSTAIQELTPVRDIILELLFTREEFILHKYQNKLDLFFQDLYREIDSIYQADGFDLNKITHLLNQKKKSVVNYLELNHSAKLGRLSKWDDNLKIIDFNQATIFNKNKYNILEQIGFSKFDKFIEIHVDSFYSTGEKNFGSELIRHDFEVLAEFILDKEPKTAAIIGESWLLSTPIAERLGFKKLDDNNVSQNNFSTWFQFIDKNGQIDQRKVNKLLTNGEFPYKSVRAYMMVEDFMKKYLPKHRRGKITLQTLNKNKEDFWNNLINDLTLIKENWDDSIKNNINFTDFILKNKAFNTLLNFMDPDDKGEYLDFLKTMYNEKTPWQEFKNKRGKQIIKIEKQINNTMEEALFANQDLVIE